MSAKKSGAVAPGATRSEGPSFGVVNGDLTVVGVDNSSLRTFASGHGAMDELPGQSLAAYEADAAGQDRFSPEHLDRASALSERRPVRKVDEELRADLLERPHLFANPQENGRRGLVAVWRSLKDQLRDETLTIIDSSTPSELAMHRRELESRRAVVASVEQGLEILIARIDQRLAESGEDPPDRESGDA